MPRCHQKNGQHHQRFSERRGNHKVRVNFDEAEILPFHATSSGLALLAFRVKPLVAKNLIEKIGQFCVLQLML